MSETLFIVKLGGSIFIPSMGNGIDLTYLSRFRDVLFSYVEKGVRFIVITGGGKLCRWYQDQGREVGMSNLDLNWLGIRVNMLNSEFVNAYLRPHSGEHPYSELEGALTFDTPILTVGAWKPGSSNLDAVLMAEHFSIGSIINLSNISHVYNADPRQHPDAQPLHDISWEQYEEIISEKIADEREHIAGDNLPFDVIATQKAKELGLRVYFCHGHDLDSFSGVLEGGDFTGTVIHPATSCN